MAGSKEIRYPGKTTTVTWQSDLCIHIGECVKARGDLFVSGRKPWCEPDLKSDAEVREIIERCPSGALSVQNADGSRPEKASARNVVQVAYNGPLFVRGDLEIEGAPAAPGLQFRAALCRCGQSKNKPFCDNSHEKAGFRDSGAVGEAASVPGQTGGRLHVKPAVNGPLLLTGPCTIASASGRESWSGDKAALCRCGGSANKPFCDGTHKRNGFTSD